MANNTLKNSGQKVQYGMKVADSVENCAVQLNRSLQIMLDACNVVRVEKVAQATYDTFKEVQHAYTDIAKQITGALAADANMFVKFDQEHNLGNDIGAKMKQLATRLESISLVKAEDRAVQYTGEDESWEESQKELIVSAINTFLKARHDFIEELASHTKTYATDEIKGTYMAYGKTFEATTNEIVKEAKIALSELTEFGDAINRMFSTMEQNAQSVKAKPFESKGKSKRVTA